ncbi:DUF397 domain-containing protein [Streptomyces sp. NPDC058665]|uniref:DUF397 domain-containing protein n=1 Tax=Streptomyces sp. NPDC058665 TaxID=3346586 RepID=UPI00364DF5AC
MKNQDVVTAFKKSSASAGGTQDCVEVAHTADGGRAVRDTKDRAAGTQFYTPAQWSAFLTGIKNGEIGA